MVTGKENPVFKYGVLKVEGVGTSRMTRSRRNPNIMTGIP